MRDFERLEELSTTVEAGLAANDVIWAVDQALAGEALDDRAKKSLGVGSEALAVLADPAKAPTHARRTTQRLIGTDMARNVREVIASQDEEADVGSYLERLAGVLNDLADGKAAEDSSDLELALTIFSVIAEAELARANSIVRTRKEPTRWLSATTTSRSS
jgi:hypothetical protein